MFTVIIAEKETIKLFEETKMFFGPLYNSKQVAFCEWDKYADDFDSMVPEIYKLIEYQNEWRALILNVDSTEKLNPFDFVNYSEAFCSEKKKDGEYFKTRREQRIVAYEKAVFNPLLKLATALTGVSKYKSTVLTEDFHRLMSGELGTGEYMLKRQLSALDCSELAARIDRYMRGELVKFVPREKEDLLISLIRNSDVSGILGQISETEIVDFIKFVGNDPIYYDPEYIECMVENTKKNELMSKLADNFTMKDKLPTDVICLSPRTFDFENADENRKNGDEVSSSNFANYNLYSDKLKFVIFDMLSKENKQYKFDQIKLLCLMLVIASNEIPQGSLNAGDVYGAEIEFNDNIIARICEKYISKLRSTQFLLKDIEMQLDCESETSVDNKTAQRLFESDINIPVKITSENSEDELYAEYKSIGLFTDCPGDEKQYWSKQYRTIGKHFLRYLREPRRAVKASVTESLRENNFVDDERKLLLSENQTEDVKFHIAEVEQKMVESTTLQLFDTKKFTEQIREADNEINRGISQRMTRKKTLIVGLVAAVSYLIGFLPLIFGNTNTLKSFLLSLLTTGIVMGAFIVVGIVYLFVLRRKLVNRFKHFNYVMSGICNQIDSSLAQFSRYLSCVCNLMRDFSVLKKRDSVVIKTKKNPVLPQPENQ